MPNCPVCNAEVQVSEGRGRPHRYCGEPCRRSAEFAIRRLNRRLDGYEIELREVESGADYRFREPKPQAARVANLQKWIAEDQARLRALLGTD